MELTITANTRCKLLHLLRGPMGLSSSLVARLKRENAFFVNGEAAFTDHLVSPGDRIAVRLTEPPPDFPAEPGLADILYEDECLIAVDKPPGLLTHPTAHRRTGTLANRLAGYFAETGQRCGIHPISRLDRDTFGVTLFAKHAHIHALCAGQFDKVYRVTVRGGPTADAGQISLPIARRENSLWREIRADGKPAVTDYRVLDRAGGLCLLELRPITGRTHQLRLHCQASGFPILGDRVYGGAGDAPAFGLTGQQLLAQSLAFVHPLTGNAVQITSKQAVFWP